jgi:serine protease Do
LVSVLQACASSPPGLAKTSETKQASGERVESATAPAPGDAPASAWIAGARPNLRELTVLVRASPPPALEAKYRQLATRYKPLEPLFVASAEEAFGSGFVMVRRESVAGGPERQRAFVVTNRHVVGLSSSALVLLGASAEPIQAAVAYVDDVYDLAVLELSADANERAHAQWSTLTQGLAMADVPARDQDVVVASGYPGIDDRPSYQVTRGFVSNESFVVDDAGIEQLYVQHTAPIDPGSSGGPLTTLEGKLLGVNTLKVRGRENVGLAVPASVVATALVELARRTSAPETEPVELQVRAACDALLDKIDAGPQAILPLERTLGASLIAEHGLASLISLPTQGDEWPGRFLEDPTGVFVRAVALRLQQGAARPVQNDARCVATDAKAGGSFAFKARLAGAERVLEFAHEQGRWKLVSGGLGRPSGRSFLDQLDSRRVPAKKWKPSMK